SSITIPTGLARLYRLLTPTNQYHPNFRSFLLLHFSPRSSLWVSDNLTEFTSENNGTRSTPVIEGEGVIYCPITGVNLAPDINSHTAEMANLSESLYCITTEPLCLRSYLAWNQSPPFISSNCLLDQESV